MIYTIIAMDGRIFFSEDEIEKIVKEAIVPLKVILDDKNKIVWKEKD